MLHGHALQMRARLGDFIKFNYFGNGDLSEIIEYKQNLIHGSLKEFDTSGNLIFEGVFKKGIENGIFKWYNEDHLIITESLFINGKEHILKNFVRYLTDTTYGYEIYRMRNDTIIETEGDIKLNDSKLPIDSLSFYFRVDLSDTVYGNDTLNFQVELLLNDDSYNSKVVLYMGELQENFTLKDTVCSFPAQNGNHIIHGKYVPNGKGYQIIAGLIDIEIIDPSDSTEKLYANLTFYHQIFVK